MKLVQGGAIPAPLQCPKCGSIVFHVIVEEKSKTSAEQLINLTTFKYNYYLQCAKCGYEIGYLCTSMRPTPLGKSSLSEKDADGVFKKFFK